MDVKYDASCANGALDNNFSERKRSVATYKLGRKTELSSVDGGTYYYDYDASSNMIHMSNTRLLNEGRKINYIYDGLNRLTEKRYEDKNGNPVVTRFTYGKPDSGNFSGRLVKTEDATGTVEVEYGSLGEIKKEVRVMKQNHDVNGKDIEAVMEYTGNYLGQMEKMKYPDGEEITYIYDDAGQICSIKGNNDDYVDDIGYDECGQRIYIKYSNGVETTYNYKKETRLLDAIKTTSKKGLLYQNIKYDFTKAGNIERYTNDCLSDSNGGNYKTWQEYGYDSLYQLTYVHGETEFNRYGLSSPEHFSEYEQTFSFDRLGNMKTKKSSEVTVTGSKKGDDLNYEFDYEVEEGRAHRYSRIGTRYYKYDEVGNLLAEQTGAFGTEDDDNLYKIEELKEKTYGMNEGWGVFNKEESAEGSKTHHRKTDRRTYEWNAENQLVETSDEAITVGYTYGADGKRASKYTHNSETLYFNDYWVWHIDNATKDRGGKVTKNIYLGTERLASRIGSYKPYAGEENENTFFYHSDHLGSAQLVTDCNGDEYQRIEYTPYGETWIDLKTQISLIAKLPYKFSAKELDEETGLYYYGARYLDPKYSRWISADPAIGEYMGKTDAGMGGIYNHVNFNLYHYAGNNPINYTDPDGKFFNRPTSHIRQTDFNNRTNPVYMGHTPSGKYKIDGDGNKKFTTRNTIFAFGCLFTEIYNNALTAREKRVAAAKKYCEQHDITFNEAPSFESLAGDDKYFYIKDNPEKNESDANMGYDGMLNLWKDTSGESVKNFKIINLGVNSKGEHDSENMSASEIKFRLRLIRNAKQGYTVIGRCDGHYFTILDCDDDGNLTYSEIHDPQAQIYYHWYEGNPTAGTNGFKKDLNVNGVNQLIIIPD